MNNRTILILATDGNEKMQFLRLLRDFGIRSAVFPTPTRAADIRALAPAGIIITGSSDLHALDPEVLSLGIPVLGIGEGTPQIVRLLGGRVTHRTLQREAGKETIVTVDLTCPLFIGFEEKYRITLDIYGGILELPAGFRAVAHTDIPTAIAIENRESGIFGITTSFGEEKATNVRFAVKNFVTRICGVTENFTAENQLAELRAEIQRTVGDRRVVTALYPTVGSVVCNALMANVLPGQVTAIYIDTGLQREDEINEFRQIFGAMPIELVCVEAADRFLELLDHVSASEEKDRLIKKLSGDLFVEEVDRHGPFDLLIANRLYDDLLLTAPSVMPLAMYTGGKVYADIFDGKRVLSPLCTLLPEEARHMGALLGLPRRLTNRHFFPMAGVGTRIPGVLTKEKIDLLRRADRIVQSELERSRTRIDLYYVVLLEGPAPGTVPTQPDSYSVAIVAEQYDPAGAPRYAHLPYPLLSHISERISKELPHIRRVYFDVTHAPTEIFDVSEQ